MAIDFQASGTHISAFPSKVLAGLGGAHQYNVRLSSAMDNGTLVGRGNWVGFDEYAQAAVPNSNPFAGVIRAKVADGSERWYVELTADCDGLFVYNSPISEYEEKKLQDEKLFYNAIGDTVRVYELRKGDIVELSTNAFTGTPVAGKTVTYASGKYTVAS